MIQQVWAFDQFGNLTGTSDSGALGYVPAGCTTVAPPAPIGLLPYAIYSTHTGQWTAVAAPIAPPAQTSFAPAALNYQQLTGAQIVGLIIQTSGMTSTQQNTMAADANLAMFRVLISGAGTYGPTNAFVTSGIAALVALGYITSGQAATALAAWPTQ